MDLSNISTPDLEAIAQNNYAKVSPAGMQEYLNQIAPVNGAPDSTPQATPAPAPSFGNELMGSLKDVASYPASVVSGLGQGVTNLANLVPAAANLIGRHTVGHNVMGYLPQPGS